MCIRDRFLALSMKRRYVRVLHIVLVEEQHRDELDGVVGQSEYRVSVRAEPASHVSGGERERAQSLQWNGLKSVREQYSRSRGPSFVRPNSRRVFRHSNTRSTTPSPPRICACEGASKQVDQRGRDAVPELQLSRHNATPPTCVSQSLQTDERRRARRGERTETQAWADAGAVSYTHLTLPTKRIV